MMARRWAGGLVAPAALALLAGCGARTAGSAPGAAPQSDASQQALLLSARVLPAEGGVDAEALLGAAAEKALSEGGTPLRVLASGAASEGDRIGGFALVHQDSCLVALARGTKQVEDLDILAFDDNGASLAADQSVGAEPGLIVCPPHPSRVYVAARVASGEGLVALGVQGIAPDRASAVAIKTGARLSTSQEQTSVREAWPGLEMKLGRRRRALSGSWIELRKVALPVSPLAESHVSTPVPAGRCLDVFVTPNEETRSLSVTVSDDQGREVVRAANQGEDRVALVCTPVDTTLGVAIRARRGHGQAAVVLSRTEQGAEVELAARPDARVVGPMQPLDDVVARVYAALGPLGLGPAKKVYAGTAGLGQTRTMSLEVPAGCTRIDVLAGSPVVGMRGSLWNGPELLAACEGGERLSAFACLPSAAKLQLEVDAVGRPGDILAEARVERGAPETLQQAPLAAGRMLARANSGGRWVPAKALRDVRAVTVEPTRRTTFPVLVPVGTCRAFIAALDRGVERLRLSATDSAGSRDLGTARGSHVAQLELCAPNRPLQALVTLSVQVGTGPALVGVVELPEAKP